MIGSIIALTLAGSSLPADPCAHIPVTRRISMEEYGRRLRELVVIYTDMLDMFPIEN